jgi:hypothetical protein
MNTILSILVSASIALMLFGCTGKEAYVISRTLLGYIPPPEVSTIMSQLEEELERCEKSGGKNCEKQAMDYVRVVNKSLERKPLKGVVVITRVDDGVEAEYFPDEGEKVKDKKTLENTQLEKPKEKQQE